jgi:RNA polymerase sigma-70 factor, ECF subfamily
VNALTASAAISARELEPYRRELTGYCYRMLGSIHEAEDAVQDTFLRAWKALERFEDRAGLRPWLYRIATNVCIDLSRGRSRRALPMDVAPVGTREGRLIDRRSDETWIGPAPDRLTLGPGDDPAEQAVSREAVRLAFVAALQNLAPRQRAVLILRDVLRWRAAEVAELLDTSADAVNSALRRARVALEGTQRDSAPGEPSPADRELLDSYIDAFERHDVDALVSLLRHDAIVEMPPFDLWLRGTDDIREWLIAVDALAGHTLTPVGSNGSLAAAVYRPDRPGGEPRAFAIHVLDVVAGRISAIHSFIDPTLFAAFGLPDRPVLQNETPPPATSASPHPLGGTGQVHDGVTPTSSTGM